MYLEAREVLNLLELEFLLELNHKSRTRLVYILSYSCELPEVGAEN